MAARTGIAAATLDTIRDDIVADSSLFADRMKPLPDGDEAGFSTVFKAAAGETVQRERDYVFALEYIYEGYLLHYGESRLLDPQGDDFHLLAGDYMYARGLNHTAAIGDLFPIRTLAELVELCSYIHCEGRERRLALEAWAIVSLCLADRALGNGSCESECRPAFEGITRDAWDGSLEAGSLGELLGTMLSSHSDETRREIEAALEEIFADHQRDGG